jgi:hypothetical protein
LERRSWKHLPDISAKEFMAYFTKLPLLECAHLKLRVQQAPLKLRQELPSEFGATELYKEAMDKSGKNPTGNGEEKMPLMSSRPPKLNRTSERAVDHGPLPQFKKDSSSARDCASSCGPYFGCSEIGEGWELRDTETGSQSQNSFFPWNVSSPKSNKNEKGSNGLKRQRGPNAATEGHNETMQKYIVQTSYKSDSSIPYIRSDSKLKQLDTKDQGIKGQMPDHDFQLCRAILIDVYMTYPFLMGQDSQRFLETFTSQDAPYLTRPLRALSEEDAHLIMEHVSVGHVNRISDRLLNGEFSDKENFIMEIRDAVVDEIGTLSVKYIYHTGFMIRFQKKIEIKKAENMAFDSASAIKNLSNLVNNAIRRHAAAKVCSAFLFLICSCNLSPPTSASKPTSEKRRYS